MITPERVAEKAERLRELEADYEKAKAFLASPAYTDLRLVTLERIEEIIRSTSIDRPEYVLGAVSEALRAAQAPATMVAKYEALKKSYVVASDRVVDGDQPPLRAGSLRQPHF